MKRMFLSMLLLPILTTTGFVKPAFAGQDCFLGEVMMFGGNFAPRGWSFLDGQFLPINSNQALFSILGTTYGGDGRTTFALPDLRGRVAIGPRTGAGLTPRTLGNKGGVDNQTLTTAQISSHTHSMHASTNGPSGPGQGTDPTGRVLAQPLSAEIYSAFDSGMASNMDSGAIGNTGSNQGHPNTQPSLAVNYIMCLAGTFPSRN